MIDPRSNAMNYVVVKGVQSPGRAQLTGVEAAFNWQIVEGYALSGAFCIFRGRGIAKPVLTIAMWKPDHFAQWDLFKKALAPPTPATPYFFEMQHPLLSAADIKAVGVESLGEPIRSTQGGLWLATIRLLEYRPFKYSLVKPDKTIPSVDKGKAIPPKTEADRALIQASQDLKDAINAGRGP